MKKIIIAIGTSYIILMAGVVGYKLINDSSCYFNYKKAVSKAEEKVKVDEASKPSTETNSKTNTEKEQTAQGNNNTTANNQGTETPAPVQENQYANVKFTKALGEGSTGDDVKKLQEILKNKQYYNGEISGIFNGDTKKALMAYQKDKKLWADGILGPGTWKTFEQ